MFLYRCRPDMAQASRGRAEAGARNRMRHYTGKPHRVSVHCVIHARWIIPVVPQNTFLEHHCLAIGFDGKILDILSSDLAHKKYEADTVIYRPTHALIPGLVNSHNHAPMALFRGFADDLPLASWLNDHIFPAESKWVDPSFVRDGTKLAIGEMLLSGTTCFNDMYFFSEESAREAARVGMRANIGMTIMNHPTAWAKTDEEYIIKTEDAIMEFKSHPLVNVWLAPHAPYTDLSQRSDARVMCHIHETTGEVEESIKQYGMRPIERLDKLNLINNKLLAVHCTQLLPEEMKLFAQRGTSVATCPESNCKLASGICSVNDLHEAGTDSVASNNELDMFGEMKMTAFLGKVKCMKPEALSAAQVLSMATINGAKATGQEKEIGSLEIGKSADLVSVDLESLFTIPVYNPISHIVYSVGRESVCDVWIKGKALVRNKQLLCYDEGHLFYIARKWGDEIHKLTYEPAMRKRSGTAE